MQLGQRPLLPSPPRVVIVDADRRLLSSLTDLLAVSGEVAVVGQANDVRQALEAVERIRPDVVLVDPRLPDVDAGLAMVSGMRRAWPDLRIVLTGWGDTAGHAIDPDAPRYVSKGSSPEEFVAAIANACCAA
jgi:two-component system, LytTR family, response regulator